MNVTHFPFDPGISGWSEILPSGLEYPELDESENADFAIVGAGFAGLSAARRLQQLHPDSRIVILEARKIAEGSSGRNSGFMIDVPHNLGSKDYAGTLVADRQQIEMNREAITFAKQAVDEFSMPQEAFSSCGKINGAATSAGMKLNSAFASYLRQLDEVHQLLDQKTMREVTGSTYYRGGLFMPGTAMIQPAIYVRELARGVHANGVKIYEHTPVIGLAKEGPVWNLKTSKASVTAEKVILAVNGHIESFGYFKRRLIHIYLYASMTQRLTSDEVRRLGGDSRWGLTPSDPLGSTVRRISGTGGDRIVVRNGFS